MTYAPLIANPSASAMFGCRCDECTRRRSILQSIPLYVSFFNIDEKIFK